jgi:hypothetical protein
MVEANKRARQISNGTGAADAVPTPVTGKGAADPQARQASSLAVFCSRAFIKRYSRGRRQELSGQFVLDRARIRDPGSRLALGTHADSFFHAAFLPCPSQSLRLPTAKQSELELLPCDLN